MGLRADRREQLQRVGEAQVDQGRDQDGDFVGDDEHPEPGGGPIAREEGEQRRAVEGDGDVAGAEVGALGADDDPWAARSGRARRAEIAATGIPRTTAYIVAIRSITQKVERSLDISPVTTAKPTIVTARPA